MMSFITLWYYCWKSKFGNKEISCNTEATPLQFDFRVTETYNDSQTIYRSTRIDENMCHAQKCEVFLWDDSSTFESSRTLLEQIKLTVRHSKSFTNKQECIQCIKENSERIILVAANEKATGDVLSECGALPQLKAIYVLNSNADSLTDKKLVYFPDSIALTQQIASITQLTKQESPTISCWNLGQRTMSELNSEAASFMWSQMLLEILKEFPTGAHDLDDMIAACQDHYRDNATQLKTIDEFRKSYSPSSSIQWYTKDSFVYRRVNEALRTIDIDALYTYRAFIVDLCSQLQRQQQLEPFSTSTVTLYRGQTMFVWELNKFIKNIDQLVSINAFFSASLNERVAEAFSGSDVFARIDKLSTNKAEEEVLFNLFTVFRVVNVLEELNGHRWRIYLEATDEGREALDDYLKISKSDVETATNEISFGRILMHMGQYGRAVKYFALLISRLDPSDVSNRANIICNQSDCLYHMCEYEKARLCLEDGLSRLDQMNMSKDDIFYLRCRFRLANLLLFTNQLKPALSIYDETLQRQRRTLHADHVHIADTLKSIGNWYGNNVGYHESLTYRREALRIYEKSLPEYHPKRISVMRSLAGTYEALGQFEKALDYLNQALQHQN
ncbi:unnamed protein product [Adineta ricciae]|uniref:NAD(P)(+)--arginine ADP-ribosyltransferase n=1 Tax=Adineta ricciae TaxID=249248 RepID=A0A814VHV4_ADIRI|nr:unnamed protein product [Adineta ricciae]CAF1185636.1 unnamed protein product [Adineta ricciae]